MKIEQVGAGVFKAKCLSLLDEVEKKHMQLIITKHGKPVARLVCIEKEKFSLYGCMKNSVVIKANVVAGIDEKWEADE